MKKITSYLIISFFFFSCENRAINPEDLSPEERLALHNIPAKKLRKMKSDELAESCLNYPSFSLLMTRNSLQQGYDYLKSIFNGFEELEQRKDAGAALLKIYSKLSPDKITEHTTLLEKGHYSFLFVYAEVMMAQPAVISNMSTAQRKQLVELCIFRFEEIQKMPDYFGVSNMITKAWVISRVLEIEQNDEFFILVNENQLNKMMNFLYW
jgi:hypothetical protein